MAQGAPELAVRGMDTGQGFIFLTILRAAPPHPTEPSPSSGETPFEKFVSEGRGTGGGGPGGPLSTCAATT